jgi:phage replication-related protein YjqB (UPF0714/DUF867 family)
LKRRTAIADRYPNFAALAKKQREEADFRIRLCDRATPIVVLAPHGGRIERGTSEIAKAIAGQDYSIYLFEGLLPRANRDLHITSANFDEPRALELVGKSATVVAIHGRQDHGDRRTVGMGGLNETLRDAIGFSLNAAGFQAAPAEENMAAQDPMNICNRGKSGVGVQLELPRALRSQLARDAAGRAAFCAAVRRTLDKLG